MRAAAIVTVAVALCVAAPWCRAQTEGDHGEAPAAAVPAGEPAVVEAPDSAAPPSAMSDAGPDAPSAEAPAAPPHGEPPPAAGETPPVVKPAPSLTLTPLLAPAADTSPVSTAAEQATAVVADFHQSLRENYRKGVLATLAPDVAVFEQGYAESSRDEYASGHLDNDLLFAATTRYEVLHREAAASGDLAWVVTQARTTGSFAGQDVDLDNTETMVLERRAGKWKIVHIHWSAHPRSE
jgi:ketosteroid isomerase-like protein